MVLRSVWVLFLSYELGVWVPLSSSRRDALHGSAGLMEGYLLAFGISSARWRTRVIYARTELYGIIRHSAGVAFALLWQRVRLAPGQGVGNWHEMANGVFWDGVRCGREMQDGQICSFFFFSSF